MSTNTMQPSSAIDLCSDCRLDPCACSYIAKLRPAGELAHLREAALEHHHHEPPHRPACPCPRCYSARLASWDIS
jgi:hypothetical protein